jgi:hypothetical protein
MRFLTLERSYSNPISREKIIVIISTASKSTRGSVCILMQATIQLIFIHVAVITKKGITVDSPLRSLKRPKD